MEGIIVWSSKQPRSVVEESALDVIFTPSDSRGLISSFRGWREVESGSVARHVS